MFDRSNHRIVADLRQSFMFFSADSKHEIDSSMAFRSVFSCPHGCRDNMFIISCGKQKDDDDEEEEEEGEENDDDDDVENGEMEEENKGLREKERKGVSRPFSSDLEKWKEKEEQRRQREARDSYSFRRRLRREERKEAEKKKRYGKLQKVQDER